MESNSMSSDEANVWKCLFFLDADKCEDAMYDLLCESIVKHKGVASVSVLKNLERATGKSYKSSITKTADRGSPPNTDTIQALMEENASKSENASFQLRQRQLTRRSPKPMKNTGKRAHRKKLRTLKAAQSERAKKHTMTEKFKELFDDIDSN